MFDAATFTPRDVDAFSASFGGAPTRDLIPPRDAIPAEFKSDAHPWVEFCHEWFFHGVRADRLRARPGVDRASAVRHCTAIMRSFDPSHEHKIAGVAYLLSLWFEPLPEPTPSKREREAAKVEAARPAPGHTCHARGCPTPVPPSMLMCRTHWSRVPKALQQRVWATYRKGQEIRKDPSPEYLAAAKAAIDAVAAKEGR